MNLFAKIKDKHKGTNITYILFGGLTVSAPYKNENNINKATFRNFTTRDPFSHIYPLLSKLDYYYDQPTERFFQPQKLATG